MLRWRAGMGTVSNATTGMAGTATGLRARVDRPWRGEYRARPLKRLYGVPVGCTGGANSATKKKLAVSSESNLGRSCRQFRMKTGEYMP